VNSNGGKSTARTFATALIASSFIALPDGSSGRARPKIDATRPIIQHLELSEDVTAITVREQPIVIGDGERPSVQEFAAGVFVCAKRIGCRLMPEAIAGARHWGPFALDRETKRAAIMDRLPAGLSGRRIGFNSETSAATGARLGCRLRPSPSIMVWHREPDGLASMMPPGTSVGVPDDVSAPSSVRAICRQPNGAGR
jgi:hypothetical protein